MLVTKNINHRICLNDSSGKYADESFPLKKKSKKLFKKPWTKNYCPSNRMMYVWQSAEHTVTKTTINMSVKNTFLKSLK